MSNDIVLDISAALRAQFAGIRCAGFRAAGLRALDLHEAIPDAATVAAGLAAKGLHAETVTLDPRIAAWRSAIQVCGLKAAKVRGSAEQLVRRFSRGDNIGGPPLVQVYCAASATAVAPLGGYDVARLPTSRIELRFAESGDMFDPLGGDASAMPLAPTIPIYAAGTAVICWMFNVRDARTSALTAETDEALFVSEALTPLQCDASAEALRILASTLREAGASIAPITWDDAGRVIFAPPS